MKKINWSAKKKKEGKKLEAETLTMKQNVLKLHVLSPSPGSTNAYFVVVVVVVWSGKGQTVNNLSCVGYTVSVTTI